MEIIGTIKSSKMPKSNIGREERQALKDLKEEELIIILPSDKDRGGDIMDKENYKK